MERLTVVIDGNSAPLTKALKSAETRLGSFNTRLTNSSRSLTRFIKSMSAASAGVGAYTASVAAMTAANQRAAASLASFATRVNATSVSTQRLAQANTAAARSTAGMNVGIKDVIMGLTSLNTLLYTSSFLFGGIVKSTIDANAHFEKMGVLLKNVSGGSTELDKSLIGQYSGKYIWDLADNSPFKIEALTDSFVKLRAAGIDPTAGSLKTLVDTVAYFGGDTEQLKRAGVALSQMLSKGKVTAEELRQQLGDAVPNAMRDMARALDMTIPELDAAMKKGLVMSADAVPKLMKLWEQQYGGGAMRMMGTWDGVMARMSNAWQKMVIRVTQESGNNSLFTTIKTQMESLSRFMSSKQGDDFLKNLTDGLGRAVVGISNAIQFMYKYRDTIVDTITVVGKFWIASRIFSLVGGVMGNLIGIGSSVINMYRNMNAMISAVNATYTAAAATQVIFGRGIRNVAAAMGLFNSVGAITLTTFARFAAVLGVATVAVAAIGGAIYEYMRRRRESLQADTAHNSVLSESRKWISSCEDAIVKMNMATGDEIQKTREIVRLKIIETQRRADAARAAVEEAKKKVAASRATFLAEQAGKNTFVGSVARGARNFLGALPGGIGGAVQNLFGQRDNFETNKAQANLDAAEKTYKGLLGELGNSTKALYDNMFNRPRDMLGDSEPLPGKTPKDKLGSTDDKRGELVSALNKIKELEALNSDLIAQHNDPQREEHMENRQDYADRADSINRQNKAIADSIKSQDELNSRTSAAQAIVEQLNIANTKRTKLNAIEKQDREALSRLQSETNDQTIQAKDAMGALDDVYNSVNAQVDRYINKLQQRNRLQLESTDSEVADKAKAEIEQAAYQRKIELTAQSALKYKQASTDIKDALLTERQLRQKNYDLEVANVKSMLANLSMKTDEEKKLAVNLNDYLESLAQDKKMKDSGPLVEWAKQGRDLKENLNFGLQNIWSGWVEGLMEAKQSFGEFAGSIVKSLGMIIARAIIAKAIMRAFGIGSYQGTGFTEYSGMESWGGAGTAGAGVGSSPLPDLSKYHTGGIIGVPTGLSGSFHPSLFKNAKKYHTGGFPGLQPNEVPIIAKKGEGVFTPEQMKALGSSGSSSVAAPTVNIINQTSSPVNQETTQPRFDGEKWVVDVLLKHANKPGPVRDMLNGRQ